VFDFDQKGLKLPQRHYEYREMEMLIAGEKKAAFLTKHPLLAISYLWFLFGSGDDLVNFFLVPLSVALALTSDNKFPTYPCLSLSDHRWDPSVVIYFYRPCLSETIISHWTLHKGYGNLWLVSSCWWSAFLFLVLLLSLFSQPHEYPLARGDLTGTLFPSWRDWHLDVML